MKMEIHRLYPQRKKWNTDGSKITTGTGTGIQMCQ